jgi:DNA replication protein DnaC
MKKRKQQQDSSRNKRDCFREMQEIERFTFSNDDRQDCNSARTLAEKYVEKFKAARTLSEVKWLILYGDPGVGKTFFAGCIANALLDAGYHVIFTSMSHIEAKLSENFNKNGLYEMLDDADLLVLDDIGSERNSSYMKEITFNIIERRKQAGKPLVVTTNIGQNDAVQKNDLGYRRIFSRLYEKSVLFQMKGNDRRKAKMLDERADRLRDLLS